MARRSFSFMLAWRYLNPRRAMLSAVTLVSVLGVLLGVLVLVAVMSVYNGLEKEVKERLLGYTPHIKLEYGGPDGLRKTLIEDWQDVADKVKAQPGVKSVAPFVQDFALIASLDGARKPYMFCAIDTDDAGQVEALDKMLDKKHFPESSSDMGLDPRVVVSKQLAGELGVGLGDSIKLYSSRNLQEAERAYGVMDQKPLRERYQEWIADMRTLLAKRFEKKGDGNIFIPADDKEEILSFQALFHDDEPSIREKETEIMRRFFETLGSGQDQENAVEGAVLPEKNLKASLEVLAELDKTDVDKMDLEAQRGIRSLILPQEAEVIGIFDPGKMAAMPEVFMPLNMAQSLSGLKDEVQALAVRLDNDHAYDAGRISKEMLKTPDLKGWVATTWIDEFGSYANLIAQQRVMMYIVLSLITVISAFSMMAVMFTVTIQKRREIGVMKALGAARGQIVKVFVYQGMILGFVGALIGCGGGLLLLKFIAPLQDLMRRFGYDPFSQSFNGFDHLPYVVVPMEVTIITISAFVLCSLAAMVPAFSAARSDAAKSLRNL